MKGEEKTLFCFSKLNKQRRRGEKEDSAKETKLNIGVRRRR